MNDHHWSLPSEKRYGDMRQEIAAVLNIGTRTMETHCKRMVAKPGLGDMKALGKHAISFQRKP